MQGNRNVVSFENIQLKRQRDKNKFEYSSSSSETEQYDESNHSVDDDEKEMNEYKD